MSSKLRERFGKLSERNQVEAEAAAEAEPAPVEDEDELDEVEVVAQAEAVITAAEAQAAADAEADEDSNVVPIGTALVDRLSDEEVEAFLAKAASAPLVAGLAMTRETKTGQLQYDGQTEDGFTVRVWAPEGAPSIIKAQLVIGGE